MWTPEIGRKSYLKHLEKRKAAHKKWAKEHPEKKREARKKWGQAHPEYILKKQRERRKILHQEVMDIYGGGKCAICGEIDYGRLTIDHKNGDGGQFRRSFKEQGNNMGGWHFYCWLRRRGYPTDLGLRVLCISCNSREWWNKSPDGNTHLVREGPQ